MQVFRNGQSTAATQLQNINDSHQCLCGFDGALGDHLRTSPQCVHTLRQDPALEMGGTEDQFILKATVLLKGCPAPSCPGLNGGHSREDLPRHCLMWWRETGWRVMGWKGCRETAVSAEIKKKINNFRKNFWRRNALEQSSNTEDHRQEPGQFEHSQGGNEEEGSAGNQEEGSAGERENGNRLSCNFCPYQGNLAHHLEERMHCLTAHIEQYLPHRAHTYRGKSRLAIFDLGLACNFCPNPLCSTHVGEESVTTLTHLGSDCCQFYQSEGEQLLKWDEELSVATIQSKLRRRKKWVKTTGLTDQIQKYHEELAKVLKVVCVKCAIQGPLMDSKKHRIWGLFNLDHPQRECLQCMNNNFAGQEVVREAVESLREMGRPTEHDDTLKKVVIEDEEGQNQRVVFVPAFFQHDEEVEEVSDEHLNPLSTTVLVPKNPAALEDIGDEASKRAHAEKENLDKIAEFFGRRHFLGPVTESLSVFWRCKLAEIRAWRLSQLSKQRKTGKGKVVSRDPPCAAVKDRNPHFAESKKACLTSTCRWSESAKEKRSQESAARSYINGQVRIKVRVTLIKKMVTDSPLLAEIIRESMTSTHGPVPLVSLAPLVLNFLKAKVSLLLKHLIAPRFTDWDLDLSFAKQEWTVEMVGYLYCEEFEELNQRIARGEVSASEVAAEVRKYPHILPTTASSLNKLTREYSLSEDRAQRIKALRQQHQMKGKPEPISLMTMCTPAGLVVSEEEHFLRERAVQLGKTMRQERSAVEAIVEIMGTLRGEGIDNLRFNLEDGRRIRNELWSLLQHHEEAVQEDLLTYQILMWKTGGDMMWTMARDPGESETDAYIPELLDASGLHMSAELSSSGDHLMPEEGFISNEVKSLVANAENWMEISFLEFVNSTLPSKQVAPVKGAASQPVVPIITSKEKKLTWRKASDSDNHSGDTVFHGEAESSYVRTNTDVRILYEKRPARMDQMVLAEFACDYILLHPSKKGYEKATSSINEDTEVGPVSGHIVAGTVDLAAPVTMKLSDGKIMRRRQDGKAVPLLLFSGSISKHGSQVMFSPWRRLEDVDGSQDEEETDDQRSARLKIFPCSVIPHDEEESDDSD